MSFHTVPFHLEGTHQIKQALFIPSFCLHPVPLATFLELAYHTFHFIEKSPSLQNPMVLLFFFLSSRLECHFFQRGIFFPWLPSCSQLTLTVTIDMSVKLDVSCYSVSAFCDPLIAFTKFCNYLFFSCLLSVDTWGYSYIPWLMDLVDSRYIVGAPTIYWYTLVKWTNERMNGEYTSVWKKWEKEKVDIDTNWKIFHFRYFSEL